MTTSSRTPKATCIKLVSSLLPGQVIQIDKRDLEGIWPYEHNGATFGPVDQILGNIMGAAYEFLAEEDIHRPGVVIFRRLKEPLKDGLRTYVEPDRRDLFRKLPNGFYQLLFIADEYHEAHR